MPKGMVNVPDLATRGEYEARLARAVARVFRLQKRRTLDALGDPPDINNLDAGYWADITRELETAIRPILEDVFEASAQEQMQALFSAKASANFELGDILADAAAWAQQYTADLVARLTNTTQRTLTEKLARLAGAVVTIAALGKLLESVFGPVRAESIAVTEVTTSITAGQEGVVSILEASGIAVKEPTWITARDDLVCLICRPRHGKPRGSNWFKGEEPPAHPWCRCELEYEVAV